MGNSERLTENDIKCLEYCITLAEEALDSGDEPFGSVLIDEEGTIIAEARNKVNEQNVLAHPEIELVQWALNHLTEKERRKTTMYTTGEHCPMCAAAHGWAGLGKIVYISSAEQLITWLKEINIDKTPIKFIPVQEIIVNAEVIGPVYKFVDKVKSMQLKYHASNSN